MKPFTFTFNPHLADGYGRSGFFALKGLRELGAPVKVYPLMRNTPPLPDWAKKLIEPVNLDTKWDIIHASADALPYYIRPYRALWTMWEMETLPYALRGAIRDASDCPLIVPSTTIAKTYRRSGVTSPIFVVPLAVDTTTFQRQERSTKGPFTVIHWSSLIPRKCPQEMVTVFQRAFPNQEDVRLVIKTRPSAYVTPSQIRSSDLRISVINKDMTPEELNVWVGQAHAGLFLSHGEGWYLEPLEAALTGLPCVVPTHSGCSAWADPNLFYTVPTVGTDAYPYTNFGPDQRWYVMDYNVAAQQLRAIYDNYKDAEHRASVAAEMVDYLYNPKAVAQKLLDTIQTIDERYG